MTQVKKDTWKSYAEGKEMVRVLWQPTWKAAELLLANPDFKTYIDSYENADMSTQLSVQPEDKKIDNRTKQGYDGCTQHFDTMWESSSQGQNIRDKALFLSRTLSIPK